ncbi:histidine phosphatase family protein [Ectopseudomonas hydrolytica]|uniref:histidine phosphatase family protein n=1 Tax=Ectopseudomonas hydrolytica TaxID=2493633 RepID=UPI003EE40D6E
MTVEPAVRRRRCYLVRHGHVDYFDRGGNPLDPRSVALSPKGEKQAQALRQALLEVRFDRAICSDYPRARQTLDLLLGNREIAAEPLPALREIRAGRLREIPEDSLMETVAGAYRKAADVNAQFMGGESWDQFQHRVLEVFFELAADQAWEHALIVSHDAVNRILLSWAAKTGLAGLAAFEQDNACLNILDIDTQDGQVSGAIIRMLNFTPYDQCKAEIHDTVLEHVFSAIQPGRLKA